MGFWPFGGREPVNVESASQVVTAGTHRETLRGKLTLYFKEPQTRSAADRAAERCAQIAGDLLRETAEHEALLGKEAELAAAIAARAPRGLPGLRAIELAALHVVTERSTPSSIPPPISVRPPPSSGAQRARAAGAGAARGSSPGLIGSPPTVIAAALAPLLRDASTRLLLGCLRAHDMIIVRRVAIDPGAADQLAALLPVSEAPPGEFEASRAAELSRWHTVLGSPVISQLRAESCAISAQKARVALGAANIAAGVAGELIDALCRTAFPGLALSSAHIDRYAEQDLNELAAESMARILRHPNSKPLRLALGPLLDAVHGDVDGISRLAKASLGSAH
ncbi:hypothetical protein ACSRUE_17520 [Sorangium sp. KYC3313]|uniref:hypothetical protein n=1 Tax=Sorangium sp. KYC3313 TaxID=3449740 RepID=UPI003F88BBDF